MKFIGMSFPTAEKLAQFMNENKDHQLVKMAANIDVQVVFSVPEVVEQKAVDKPVEQVEKPVEPEKVPVEKPKKKKRKYTKKVKVKEND
jgi:hypothetical protein